MKFVILLIILNFRFLITYDFANDLKKLKKWWTCDKGCYFEQEEITLKTYKKWPNQCGQVCGIITLNQNSDVPIEKLKAIFKELIILDGGIRVENSSYTSLGFLPDYFEMFCSMIGTSISNNTQLTDISALSNFYQWYDCPFRLSDNPILDTSGFCESDYYKDHLGLLISGNLVDCGCSGGKLTLKTLKSYQECERIDGKLFISDSLSVLSPLKIKVIKGGLEVKNTNFQNLSFLENLLEIKGEAHGSTDKILINIHDNPELRSLGLKGLKNLTNLENFGHFTINLQNLHPDFCISVEEMSFFVDSDVKFPNLQARYCPYQLINWPIDKPKLCVFDKMANLDTGCQYILGDLLIDSGDEEYVQKLKSVIRVFGSVIVRNTSLTEGNFLRKLEKVINLNASNPSIHFLFNKNLQNLNLLNATYFPGAPNSRIVFEGNHRNIFEKTRQCMLLAARTQVEVLVDGKKCKSLGATSFDEQNFDFSEDIDYGEGAYDEWYYNYDGPFFDWDLANKPIFDHLELANDWIALVGFLINILHLILLLQKELRGNFIYIMMIGICICDLIMTTILIMDHLLANEWIYERIDGCQGIPYYHAVFIRYQDPLNESSRRASSLLAFAMSLFRTCSVMFPMSSTITRVSKPTWALALVILIVLISSSWDVYVNSRCEFKVIDANDDDSDMCFEEYGWTGYLQDCVFEDQDDNDDFEIYNRIDGITTITIGISYLITTVLLLNQLRITRNRRKSLKSEKSENTSMLVTIMGVSFFVVEVVYGGIFILDEVLGKYPMIRELEQKLSVMKWTLLSLNSTLHCIICVFMSSQYRSVFKRVFLRMEKVVEVVDLQSISVTRESKGSTKRTY